MMIRAQVSRHFLFSFWFAVLVLFAFNFAMFDLNLLAIHSLVSLAGNFVPATKTAKKFEKSQSSLIRNSRERNIPHFLSRILMLCFPLPPHCSLSATHVIQHA
jgi:hypothetical protein